MAKPKVTKPGEADREIARNILGGYSRTERVAAIAQALAAARAEGHSAGSSECRETAARIVDSYGYDDDSAYSDNAREAAEAIRSLQPKGPK